MPAYAFTDENGYVTQGGQHPKIVPDGAWPLRSTTDLARLSQLMFSDGAWTTRPVLQGPEVDGGNLWFDGLPALATVIISNAITGQTVATPQAWVGGASILLGRGSYLIRITAPDPWLDYEGVIEIEGGDPQRQKDVLENAQRAKRALMKCSRLQGRLVLGQAICVQIDAMASDPLTPWGVRETITNAIEWSRLSETMDTFGYAMGFTAEQMDALFEAAMQVNA